MCVLYIFVVLYVCRHVVYVCMCVCVIVGYFLILTAFNIILISDFATCLEPGLVGKLRLYVVNFEG